MSVKTADKSLAHLYPPFRVKLDLVLHDVSQATGEEWIPTETYRSAERQTWLYSIGRTQPGKMVTWLRVPLLHGAGLAADCMPKKRGYNAPMTWWWTYRRIYQKHGLGNTAWGRGDLGHVEWNDAAIRARALAWVRNGFKDPPPEPVAAGGIAVIVDGEPAPDADAFLSQGRVWVKLRPVTDGLDMVIAAVEGAGAARTALLVDDAIEERVPVVLKGGRAFVRVADLPAKVLWIGAERIVSIARRA